MQHHRTLEWGPGLTYQTRNGLEVVLMGRLPGRSRFPVVGYVLDGTDPFLHQWDDSGKSAAAWPGPSEFVYDLVNGPLCDQRWLNVAREGEVYYSAGLFKTEAEGRQAAIDRNGMTPVVATVKVEIPLE